MRPKKINLKDDTLSIIWDNDSETTYSLKLLRDECPCAGCKGETVLFKTFKPAKMQLTKAESYQLDTIKAVGTYALQFFWKDGHNTGFYTYDYLLELFNNPDKQNYTNINDN